MYSGFLVGATTLKGQHGRSSKPHREWASGTNTCCNLDKYSLQFKTNTFDTICEYLSANTVDQASHIMGMLSLSGLTQPEWDKCSRIFIGINVTVEY